jgi:predicted metal-dependent hydrolase
VVRPARVRPSYSRADPGAAAALGSCNRAGDLRLNWRIMQAPMRLVDYVVAHELGHVVRGDDGHAPAFWAQLGRVLPDYDARRDALRALGSALEW